jgi:hypothetical protein
LTGPAPFSVARLLDDPDAETEAIRPDEPLLPRFTPPSSPLPIAASPPPVAPAPPPPMLEPALPPPQPFAPAPPPQPLAPPPPPQPLAPAPPVLAAGNPFPPMRTPDPDEVNPFAEEDDGQTVADVIPAIPEVSRSLQAEPSWTTARQSTSLGELQRWVQETRTVPKSRREAIARWWHQVNQRITVWMYHRGIPRWALYATLGVVLMVMIALIAHLAGSNAPAAGSGEPRAAPPTAPAGDEIELTEEPTPPPKPKP